MLITEPKDRGILLVDDEPDATALLMELFRDMLEFRKVFAANDMVETTRLVSAHGSEIYLIIQDDCMEGYLYSHDGLPGYVEQFQAATGIILMSCILSTAGEQQFLESSTDWVYPAAVIRKPIDVRSFVQQVKEILDRVHKRRLELSASPSE